MQNINIKIVKRVNIQSLTDWRPYGSILLVVRLYHIKRGKAIFAEPSLTITF